MKPMYQRVWLLASCLLLSLTASSQVRTVSGTVFSEDTTPLPGVNVIVKGTTTGTQTDANGDYALEASAEDVLVFSFIGYESQEIRVGASTSLDVTMLQDITSLDEVVVVGYGEQSRKTVTSSIAKLDNQVLASVPRSNLGSALQGTVPGLQVVNTTGQPGATPSILLRGGASINNPGSPLVVVDGIIRSFNDIAVEDIESIQVLKDAASTAIYGARANNGVILITTKKGKSGQAEISYKFTGAFNQRRDGYNYLGARDFIHYNRLGNMNSGISVTQANNSRGFGLLTDPANLASFDIRKLDNTTRELLSQGWEVMPDPYNPTTDSIIFRDHNGEIEDLVFRNNFSKDHYLSATGGNDKGRYFASFNYYDEDGIIVGSDYKRYTGNVNGSYKVRPNVEVSTGVMLSTSSQVGTIGGDINTLYRNLAIWPTFNPWLDEAKTMPNPGNGTTDGNPLYWLSKTQRDNEVNRITANASVTWDILPGLYVKGTANAYLLEDFDNSFRKATQTYSQIFATNPSFNTSRPAFARLNRDFQQQYNGIIGYSTVLAENHNVDVMLGSEFFSSKAFDMQVSGTEAPTDDIPTVNASTVFSPGSNYSSRSEYRIISAFGRLNYDYRQRYLLTAVFRQDAVSRLAEENRVGFFPGMSAGWNIQNEPFFQNSGLSRFVSTLKPRISYGENGNIAGVGNYEVQGGYGNVGLYEGEAGFLNTAIINSGLRWEQSRTTDVGLDIGLNNDRITLILDYFDRTTSDLLTNLSLPSYTGFGSIRTNLGTYQNKGIELAANANLLDRPSGFRLDVSANASFVKNKILKLPYNGNERNRQGGMQVYDPEKGEVVWVGGLQEGGRLGDIYGFKQVGIFRDEAEIAQVAANRVDEIARIGGPETLYATETLAGTGKITPGDVNWLDVDKNDTIDSRDQVYLGNIYPKWTGGFSTKLSYKGFGLYARFDFAVGHTIYNDLVARTLGNFQGTFNLLDLSKEAWSPSNPDSDIPKVYSADQRAAPQGKKNYTRANRAGAVLNGNNSRFYENGSYVACREITLSYDFPRSLIEKSKVLSNARIYTTASNLFYLTEFSGPTPEPPLHTDGVYRGTYPTPKTFILGVQVSF